MIRNYFRVALRNLARHKFFSGINIFGLAISLSLCLAIIMLVADQLMYDRYNTNRDRIYRVTGQTMNANGTEGGNEYATAPMPVAEALLNDYTGTEKAVRFVRGFGNGWTTFENYDVNIPLAGFFADPGALNLLEYELEYGNAETALKEPHSVVLTRKAADKLFKQPDPTGEVIKVGDLGEYKVTGVIKDKDQKSHIAFEALASMATLKSLPLKTLETDWANSYSSWTYILLAKGHEPEEIQAHLEDITNKHEAGKSSTGEKRKYKFALQNLSAITPGPLINNPIGPFMPRILIYFFGGLALIVMLTSCFNYTSLSIARALTRAREIGVRKVNGAHRYQIFTQFLCESLILAFASLMLAVLILTAIKPLVLNLQFAQLLRWDLEGNPYVYGVFILFTAFIGILAGFFPAVILSKFQPIKVLKAAGSMKLFSRMGLRKSLLVVQFSVSLIFIISVIVLYNQLTLFVRADHGFDMSNIIRVRLNETPYESLQHELAQYPNIQNAAAASHLPAAGTTYGDDFKRNLSDDETININYFYTDHNYIDNMKLELVAGVNFRAEEKKLNKTNIIINEKAVKKFNFASPHDAVGEVLYVPQDSTQLRIIGVVKDYNHQVLMSELDPMALRYDSAQLQFLQVRYTGSHDQAIKSIEAAWAKVNPALKIDHRDMEEEIRSFYKTMFSDVVSIVAVMSFMAIAISCLGLLGMATYAIEVRQKEISIRKVLGSGNVQLVLLLSKGFVWLLLIAIGVAVPAAWFINNLWLQHIAYRTPLNAIVIGSGIGIVFLLGAITIGSQTLKAALTNPVDALKNE